MYLPYYAKQINLIDGTRSPSQIKYRNTGAYEYWCRSLFQRAVSALEWSGWPEEWDGMIQDFFKYCLLRFGFVAVFERAESGLTFQPCTLYGYDLYYQPTEVLIANPAFPESLRLRIGEECALIKLTPDYMGNFDVIDRYASKLSMLDTAIDMSIINNKFAFFLAAKNKAAAKTLKKILDMVNSGIPAVVYDSKLLNDDTDQTEPWQFWERKNLKESYLTTDQLQDEQTILNNFDAEIGIPALPYQKKERLITTEADTKSLDSVSRASVWIDTLTESLKEVNSMFGCNLSVKLRFDPQQEGEQDNGTGEDNADRPGDVPAAEQQKPV